MEGGENGRRLTNGINGLKVRNEESRISGVKDLDSKASTGKTVS